jgi:hypothetical protein
VREVFEGVIAGFAAGESSAIVPCYGFDDDPNLDALHAVGLAAPNPPAHLLQAQYCNVPLLICSKCSKRFAGRRGGSISLEISTPFHG